MARVMIATPHAGLVDPLWLDAFLALEKPAGWMRASVVRRPIAYARNLLVTAMLDPKHPRVLVDLARTSDELPDYGQATHILFLDDDVLPPVDALTRLLSHDVPIVSGFYVARGASHLPMAYRQAPTQDGQPPRYVPLIRFVAGLQEVDGCGAGCLLVKREVFERMPAPWFDFRCGADVGANVGEDLYFTAAARAAGFTVLLDFDVHCRHLGTVPFGQRESVEANRGGIPFASPEDARLSQDVRPWPRHDETPTHTPAAPARRPHPARQPVPAVVRRRR